MSGKGLESGLNGEYDAYGLLILDDILEGVQDVLSPDVLKRKRTIYQNNVLSRAKENCKIVNVGTIWATNDIYMQRRETLETNPEFKDRKFTSIVIPALDPETDESNFDYEFGCDNSNFPKFMQKVIHSFHRVFHSLGLCNSIKRFLIFRYFPIFHNISERNIIFT